MQKSAKESEKMKIFDFHLHPGYDFHNDELGYEITPEIFTQGLKKSGISFCAGSTIHKADASRPLEEYSEIFPRLNRESYAFYERYPQIYTPGIHIHPEFPKLSCREIEYYADKGVRLIGELVPYMQRWEFFSDTRLIEILKLASERKMVLSFHPSNNTEDMEGLFKALPDLKIVVAHLDGYGLYDWSIEMMRKYENVYFDISAHGINRAGMLRDAVNKVGKEKILYGSDYPGYSHTPFTSAVQNSGLSDCEQEAIFYKNAERLLGIKIPD